MWGLGELWIFIKGFLSFPILAGLAYVFIKCNQRLAEGRYPEALNEKQAAEAEAKVKALNEKATEEERAVNVKFGKVMLQRKSPPKVVEVITTTGSELNGGTSKAETEAAKLAAAALMEGTHVATDSGTSSAAASGEVTPIANGSTQPLSTSSSSTQPATTTKAKGLMRAGMVTQVFAGIGSRFQLKNIPGAGTSGKVECWVARKGMGLFIYSDPNYVHVIDVLPIQDYDVQLTDVQGQMYVGKEGKMFGKLRPVTLTKFRAPKPEEKERRDSAGTGDSNGVEPEGLPLAPETDTLPGRTTPPSAPTSSAATLNARARKAFEEPEEPAYQFYFRNPSIKEDFYLSVLMISHDAPTQDKPSLLKGFALLRESIDAHEDDPFQMRFFNVLFGRIFLSLCSTQLLVDLISAKIEKKLGEIPQDSFIKETKLVMLDIGKYPLSIHAPCLKSFTPEGETSGHVRVAYRTPPEEEDACLSASISATTLAGVTLFVSAKVTRLEGNLEIKIKAPPSNRVWYGFTSMPEMDVKIEPEIGSLKIPEWVNTHFVTAIKKAISDTIVLPFMDDIPFYDASRHSVRGGLFHHAAKTNKGKRDNLVMATIAKGRISSATPNVNGKSTLPETADAVHDVASYTDAKAAESNISAGVSQRQNPSKSHTVHTSSGLKGNSVNKPSDGANATTQGLPKLDTAMSGDPTARAAQPNTSTSFSDIKRRFFPAGASSMVTQTERQSRTVTEAAPAANGSLAAVERPSSTVSLPAGSGVGVEDEANDVLSGDAGTRGRSLSPSNSTRSTQTSKISDPSSGSRSTGETSSFEHDSPRKGNARAKDGSPSSSIGSRETNTANATQGSPSSSMGSAKPGFVLGAFQAFSQGEGSGARQVKEAQQRFQSSKIGKTFGNWRNNREKANMEQPPIAAAHPSRNTPLYRPVEDEHDAAAGPRRSHDSMSLQDRLHAAAAASATGTSPGSTASAKMGGAGTGTGTGTGMAIPSGGRARSGTASSKGSLGTSGGSRPSLLASPSKGAVAGPTLGISPGSIGKAQATLGGEGEQPLGLGISHGVVAVASEVTTEPSISGPMRHATGSQPMSSSASHGHGRSQSHSHSGSSGSTPVLVQPGAGRSMVVPRVPKRAGEVTGLGSTPGLGMSRTISAEDDSEVLRSSPPMKNEGKDDVSDGKHGVPPPLPARKLDSAHIEDSMVNQANSNGPPPLPVRPDYLTGTSTATTTPPADQLQREPTVSGEITRGDLAAAIEADSTVPPTFLARDDTKQDDLASAIQADVVVPPVVPALDDEELIGAKPESVNGAEIPSASKSKPTSASTSSSPSKSGAEDALRKLAERDEIVKSAFGEGEDGELKK